MTGAPRQRQRCWRQSTKPCQIGGMPLVAIEKIIEERAPERRPRAFDSSNGYRERGRLRQLAQLRRLGASRQGSSSPKVSARDGTSAGGGVQVATPVGETTGRASMIPASCHSHNSSRRADRAGDPLVDARVARSGSGNSSMARRIVARPHFRRNVVRGGGGWGLANPGAGLPDSTSGLLNSAFSSLQRAGRGRRRAGAPRA